MGKKQFNCRIEEELFNKFENYLNATNQSKTEWLSNQMTKQISCYGDLEQLESDVLHEKLKLEKQKDLVNSMESEIQALRKQREKNDENITLLNNAMETLRIVNANTGGIYEYNISTVAKKHSISYKVLYKKCELEHLNIIN